MKAQSHLKRRIAPSTPLTLELLSDGNLKEVLNFKLAFDFNAAAAIKEKTGLSILDTSVWANIGDPKVLRVMFWAAVHAHQPEYDCEEGLEVIGSYMDESNSELIAEALWKAYLLNLPAEKRELIVRLRDEHEAARAKGEKLDPMRLREIIMAVTKPNSGQSPATISASATESSAA